MRQRRSRQVSYSIPLHGPLAWQNCRPPMRPPEGPRGIDVSPLLDLYITRLNDMYVM